MADVKLRAKLGADEIRAAMQDKPRRRWSWQKMLVNLLEVIGILLILFMLWVAAIDLIPEAVDHELDRMPTAGSVAVVDEDEPADPDRDLLAALIHAEARGESFNGKVAVGAVVLNRVDDPRWPDTVEAVVLSRDSLQSQHRRHQRLRVRRGRRCRDTIRQVERCSFMHHPLRGAGGL